MSNKQFTYLMVGIVVLFFTIVLLVNNGFFNGKNNVAKQDQETAENTEAKATGVKTDLPPGPGYVKIGGVWRKKSDIGKPVVPNSKIKEGSLRSPGLSPLVKADANPQVQSIKQALASKQNPERLTVFKSPKKFDKSAFDKNPEPFLKTIEPARAMMPAQPGPDVSPIRKNSPGMVKLIQGESTSLQVQVEPNAFVTFHTTDLGAFSNGIKTINVKANEEGVAEATYTATTGTIGNVQVAAASPYNSEMVRFVVNVRLPEPTAKIDQ